MLHAIEARVNSVAEKLTSIDSLREISNSYYTRLEQNQAAVATLDAKLDKISKDK